MTTEPTFKIPGLANVWLDTEDPEHPNLEVILRPEYRGDLNDLAAKSEGPANVFIRCNEQTAKNHEDLRRFMEVLAHHDDTGDDIPDCQRIIDAIEAALYKTDDAAIPFHRPTGGWFMWLINAIMPPAPPYHIVYSFGELKLRFRWYHYLAAVPLLAMMIGLISVQVHFVPWLGLSVISGFLALIELTGLPWWLGVALFVVGAITVGRLVERFKKKGDNKTKSVSPFSVHTYGFFNKAAIYEEQAFREGSEHWTLWQRTRSCFAFGLMHMANLFYPLATIIPLAIGGAIFMTVYLQTLRKTRSRRMAVLEASVWHRVYNRIALTALVVSLVLSIGVAVVGWLVAAVILLLVGLVFQRQHARQVKAELARIGRHDSSIVEVDIKK